MEEGGGWEDGWGFWIGHFCGAQEVVFFFGFFSLLWMFCYRRWKRKA